jgi:hypothetical protein
MSTAEASSPERAPAEALPKVLESRLAAMAEAVSRLDARVSALESSPAERKLPLEAPPAAAPAHAPAEVLPNPVRLTGLLGRTCLILGGATFIRSLVDAHTLPQGSGVALGLAYAMTWTLLADRARHPLDATFHALASILIAYPLIVESTAHFGILTPPLAAFLLLTVTCLHGAVAWRRNLQPIAWMATFASLGSGLALMASRRSIEPFLAVMFILGIGTLWLTQGRRWEGLRWPTALAANLGVFILTSLAAWPGGIPETYRGITAGRSMVFAVTLPLLYLGSFALRMLRHRCRTTIFEITQTVLVLLLGYGGALHVALASGSGAGMLGSGCLLAGLGSYGAAIPFRQDLEEARPNFRYFMFLAFGLLLLGGPLVLPLGFFALLCGALGLAATLVGLHLRRPLFILQSGLYLLTSAAAGGLLAWSFRAFLLPAGGGPSLSLAGFLSLACLSATVVILTLRQRPEVGIGGIRLLIQVLGAAVAGGIGALVIQACCSTLSPGAPDPGLLAAVRTGVMSGLAILLAWCGRRFPALELRWLVYPLLIVTALKFLFEDLAVGRPLTLFLGFMCYGITLMLAPRLLKVTGPSDKGREIYPLKPEVHP